MNHLSISQLGMWYRCPEQYRRRYVLGEKIPPGIQAYVGSAVHGASQGNFENKRDYDADLKESDLKDIAASSYDEKIAESGVFIPLAERPAASNLISRGKDVAVALVELLCKDFIPTIKKPVFIEQKMWIKDDDLPPILGYVDLYDSDHRLSDLKTRSSKMSQDIADSSMQISVYREMIKRETGEFPESNTLDILVKNKTPVYQKVETLRHDREWEQVKIRFRFTVDQLNAGLFPPAEPGQWICSPKWCGYWHTCKYVSWHRRHVPKRSE